MRTLRVTRVIVQPILEWDDPDALTPGRQNAFTELPLSKLCELPERMSAGETFVLVQPVLMWDDGETISPGPATAPVKIPLSQVANQADTIRAELIRMQAELDQADAARKV